VLAAVGGGTPRGHPVLTALLTPPVMIVVDFSKTVKNYLETK